MNEFWNYEHRYAVAQQAIDTLNENIEQCQRILKQWVFSLSKELNLSEEETQVWLYRNRNQKHDFNSFRAKLIKMIQKRRELVHQIEEDEQQDYKAGDQIVRHRVGNVWYWRYSANAD